MKTLNQQAGSQGFAIVIVMGLLLVLSVILGILGTMSSQTAFMARRMTDTARARAIAEAGVHEAYSIISTNYAQRTNSAVFPRTMSFAGGSYTVWIVTNGNGSCAIHGRGQFGSGSSGG